MKSARTFSAVSILWAMRIERLYSWGLRRTKRALFRPGCRRGGPYFGPGLLRFTKLRVVQVRKRARVPA